MLRLAAMLSVKACDAVPPPVSVTVAVKLNEPELPGVPVICPFGGCSESPAGRDPLVTLQVYGVVPPDAVSVYE